jgi:hypothetical protein
MALVAFAMLLATSLLQPCVCDVQASSTLKAIMSSLRRRDAKEFKKLREHLDRRLTDDMMTISSSCLAACPDLQDMQTDMIDAILSNTPESIMNGGDDTSDMSFVTTVMEATLDVYCANTAAIQCAIDNPTACAEETSDDDDGMGLGALGPSLDCFCDVCPSAKTAYIDLFGVVLDGLSDMSFQFTTPQPFDVGTTELDVGDFDGNPFDDMTDEEKDMMCMMYPILNCAVTYPTECGGGVLTSMLNVSMDESAGVLSLMEDECPAPTPAPTSDTGDDEASSCGSISLGWLSASLWFALAAIKLEAV